MTTARRPLPPLLLAGALLLALVAALLAVPPSDAVPRYAAQYGQRCILCHDNPTGGGKRNAYATQFLSPTELTWFTPSPEQLDLLDPQIGANLSVGCDLRTMHHYADDPNEPRNFLQMEGDLYLHFHLGNRIAAHMSRGMSGEYEVFGVAQVLPGNGYVKVGRLVPPFGWRLADHTAFVRDYGGFFPPSHSDVGVEIGYDWRGLEAQAAVLNGTRGSVADTDDELAFSGRAAYHIRVSGVALAAGGSYARNRISNQGTQREAQTETLAGPFGYLSWGPLTWVGESDWLRVEDAKGDELVTWSLSHELSCRVRRGLALLVTHDFYDEDYDEKSGALNRFGAGLELFAHPAVQLRGMVNFYEFEVDESASSSSLGGSAAVRDDYVQTEVQVHFLY
jgi:hypothetical protein